MRWRRCARLSKGRLGGRVKSFSNRWCSISPGRSMRTMRLSRSSRGPGEIVRGRSRIGHAITSRGISSGICRGRRARTWSGGNCAIIRRAWRRNSRRTAAWSRWGFRAIGVPLQGMNGEVLGHLAIFDDRPMPQEPKKLFVLRIFAARAAAELERLRYEQMLVESERRFRDLYDEAPIAYIYEDLDSRFVRANRAAMKLLGLRPEEVPGTLGKSLLAPTPEMQQRVAEALAAMKNEGKEFACVELELRRKDDGRPVWVQWFSKPQPDGKHTRTMLIDITERVLMERENVYLQEEIKSVHNFDEIVGRSPPLVLVLQNVRRVAATDASVLVYGETGT